MNYPWQPGTHGGDEVDSLQADVMRFIAIFGLCLAAIFSLVREAEHELASPTPPESVAERPVVPAIPEKVLRVHPEEPKNHEPKRVSPLESQAAQQAAIARPQPEPETKPEPEPPAPVTRTSVAPDSREPEPGFTLQFESSAVLHDLMLRGAIQVYARKGDSYRMLDGRGKLIEARPPSSYYGMDSSTLPDSIRVAASGLREQAGVQWVVTLPENTARRIVELMRAHENGVLVIGADTSVRRHAPH